MVGVIRGRRALQEWGPQQLARRAARVRLKREAPLQEAPHLVREVLRDLRRQTCPAFVWQTCFRRCHFFRGQGVLSIPFNV